MRQPGKLMEKPAADFFKIKNLSYPSRKNSQLLSLKLSLIDSIIVEIEDFLFTSFLTFLFR